MPRPGTRAVTLDDETIGVLQQWADYISKRAGIPVSIPATIRWLAMVRLDIKKEKGAGDRL